MAYTKRKDGGKFIPTKFESVKDIDWDLLVEIGYNKDVADYARAKQMKYREAFIKLNKESKDGQDKTKE